MAAVLSLANEIHRVDVENYGRSGASSAPLSEAVDLLASDKKQQLQQTLSSSISIRPLREHSSSASSPSPYSMPASSVGPLGLAIVGGNAYDVGDSVPSEKHRGVYAPLNSSSFSFSKAGGQNAEHRRISDDVRGTDANVSTMSSSSAFSSSSKINSHSQTRESNEPLLVSLSLAVGEPAGARPSHQAYQHPYSNHERLTVLSFVPSLAIIFPAMLSGATQAALFNPIDRALFLRVINRRSLFHYDNWRNPFQGFANAGIHRMLSAGGYLCWQEVMRRAVSGRFNNEVLERFSVGLVAGTVMGLSLNGLQFVKYRLWTEGSGSFWQVTHRLRREAGVRIFFRGTSIGILRDSVFGLTYEVLRGSRSKEDPSKNFAGHHFIRDTAAGCVACWTSAPLNYCRNIVYGVPPLSCPLGIRFLMKNLYTESMAGGTTWVQRWNVMNTRLNLGWAALRVGVGIAVGQNLFEFYKYQYWLAVNKQK